MRNTQPVQPEVISISDHLSGTEFIRGFDQYPKPIKKYARSILTPTHYVIWEIVWDKTLGWKDVRNGKREEWDRISNSQFEEEMNLSGRRIRDALNWMVDNEWLERRIPDGQQIREYRLHPLRLEEGLYAESLEWAEEQQATPDGSSAPPRTDRPPPKKGFKERRNPPTPFDTGIDSNRPENEISEKWVGEIFSDQKGKGMSYEEMYALQDVYDGIYDPDVIRRFREYVMMFKLDRRCIVEFLASKLDFKGMCQEMNNVKKDMEADRSSDGQKYGGRAVYRIRQNCAEMEV